MPGCTPAGLAAEMLIHHNVVISQRSQRERSGGMREPWQHGTGGRAGGQRSAAREAEARFICGAWLVNKWAQSFGGC